MVKKYLFKKLIVLVTVVSSVFAIGCANSNNVVEDTNIDVQVVDATEIMEEDAEAEDIEEVSVSDATVSEELGDDVELTDNSTVATGSAKEVAVATKDSDVTTVANSSAITSKDGKTATTSTAGSNGTVTTTDTSKNEVVKPASIPTNIPNNGKTTKPVEMAKNETNNVGTQSNSSSVNVSGNANNSSVGNAGVTKKDTRPGYVDRYGVSHKFDTVEERDAYMQKDHDDYVNGFTTTVTVNNEVTELISDKRESKGQNRLDTSDELNEIAKKRAEEIASDFSHNSASGTGTGSEIIQGSIGGGQSAQDTVNNYDESVMHGAQMGDDRNASAGSATATVTDSDGNVVAQYDVTVFDSDDDSGITWEVYDPISGNGPTE